MTIPEAEVRKIMAEVAVLTSKVTALELCQKSTEAHDQRQDTALYAVENRATSLERTWAEYAADREDEKKKSEKRWKAIMAICLAIGSDNLGYNLWTHAQPYLAPYMSKQFFWFSVTVVMFLLFTYGIWIGLNSFKTRRKSNG